MLVTLSLVLMLQGAASGGGLSTDVGPRVGTVADGATLEVSVDKSNYQVGETLQLRFTIRNTSSGDIRCHCTAMRDASVLYRRNGEAFRELRVRDAVGHVFPEYSLKPGEAVTETLSVSYDMVKDGPPFDGPGTYEFYAVYVDRFERRRKAELVSERVRAVVVELALREAYAAYSRRLARLAQYGAGADLPPETGPV